MTRMDGWVDLIAIFTVQYLTEKPLMGQCISLVGFFSTSLNLTKLRQSLQKQKK